VRNRFIRWRVAVQTALIVLAIVVAKLLITAWSLEFIELSPLFTSVLAGGVFVLGLEDTQTRIVESFRHDLGDPDTFRALQAIDDLNETFLEMDRIGVPATYTSRLRNEQGALRRSVLRVYHVQRTEFLPSAYLLIQSIVALIITVLAFTETEGPQYQAVIILGFISFFFISLLRLLRIMDRPFHVEEHTQDDVSLFLLRRFVERLQRSRA
jgi:hypothetical protein